MKYLRPGMLLIPLALALLTLAGGPAGAGPFADEYEPDDSAASAARLWEGDVQFHTLHQPGDEDWVEFWLEEGETLRVETDNLSEECDTVLTLYDRDGVTQLERNDDGGFGHGSRIDYTVPRRGSYYARVEQFNDQGGDEYSYELTLEVAEAPEGDCYEPDNRPEDAQRISTQGVPETHTLHVPLDADWYRFEAEAGTLIIAETLDLENDCDTVLTLYAANGARLAESDDYRNEDRSLIRHAVSRGGLFYARVRHTGDRGGRGRSYQMRVRTVVPEVGGKLSVPARLVFPATRAGGGRRAALTVRNLSRREALQVDVSAGEAPFALAGGAATVTLPPGGTHTFRVSFRPTTAGRAAGQLVVASSDPQRPQATVALSGTAR